MVTHDEEVQPRLWLQYHGQVLRVGSPWEEFYRRVDDSGRISIPLKRGRLNQISDYTLTVEFEEDQVTSISAAFD